MEKTNSTMLCKINDALSEIDCGLLHKLCIAKELEQYVPVGEDFDYLVDTIYEEWLEKEFDLIEVSANVSSHYKEYGDLGLLVLDSIKKFVEGYN